MTQNSEVVKEMIDKFDCIEKLTLWQNTITSEKTIDQLGETVCDFHHRQRIWIFSI